MPYPRQSVSKWETGEAVPEIQKLLLLSKAFSVTTDWLLNEDEPMDDIPTRPAAAANASTANTTWVDAVPGVIGRLLRKYGWLFGVYLAVVGALFTGMGALSRTLARSVVTSPFDSGLNTTYFGSMGMPLDNGISGFAANNPVTTMGTAIMGLGIVMMIAGVILAAVLKQRSHT